MLTMASATAQSPKPVGRGPQAAPTPPELIEANRQYRRGELAPALDRLDAFLRKDATNAKARFLRGVILAEQKKTDEAIQAFVSLTQDHPELAEPYNNLGVLYAGRGRYAQARDAFLAALQANPKDAVAQENLADVYVGLAIQSYEQALSHNTNNRPVKDKLTMLRELANNRTRASNSPSGIALGQADRPSAGSEHSIPSYIGETR